MRKKYVSAFCVFLLLYFVSPVLAQDFTVGTGTSGNAADTYPTPFPGKVEGSRAQYLFRAAELQAAGLTRGYITGMKMKVNKLNGIGALLQYTIKMGATAVDTLRPTAWESSPAQYFTNASYTPLTGDNTFPFSDNFFWNGTSNILVEICTNGGNDLLVNQTANAEVSWTTGLSFKASHTYGANDVRSFCSIGTTTETGTATTRPNMTFSWMAAPPDCSGTPVAGTAVANRTAVCPAEIFKLSRTAPAAMGLTYQWQSSTDNNTWTNIATATKDTLSTTLIAETWYRVMVTCTSGNLSSASASVKVSRSAGVSGTFTIDNSLVTPGPGQFKSFNDAYNYIKCGVSGPVVFNVVNTGAPYNEQLIMDAVYGTSATNTITFNGNNASIAYASGNAAEKAVIKLNGTDYVTFDKLNITALGTGSQYGVGVQLLNDADYNTIKNCTITVDPLSTGYDYAGLVINSSSFAETRSELTLSDYNNITNNIINGGRYGVVIVGGPVNGARYNVVKGNTIKNFYQYGMYLSFNNGTLVEANDISRPDRTSSLTNDQYNTYVSVVGINMQSSSRNVIITKNKIHSPYEKEQGTANVFYGIRMNGANTDQGAENIISNNLIYDIKGHGDIYGIYNASSLAAFYYNNTISLDAPSQSLKMTAGFYQTGTSSWLHFQNNIISITRTGPGLKYAIYVDNPALFTADNNDYYVRNLPTNFVGRFNGKDAAKLADWKTLSSQDANSFAVNPGFTNLSANDLKPTSAVIADKGTPLDVVTTDIAGVARNATKPDMGAYEFTLQGCLTNLAPGTAYTSVGLTSCPDKAVTLDLKGNDVALGITYQWQKATSSAGPWQNISDPLQFPTFNTTTEQASTYYRAAVSCNLGTPVYTVPVMITAGGLFPGGTYTIDKTQPTDPVGTKNFNSFKDAVNAIACGIAGAVLFNVKPGVYNEQIRINDIAGVSATNTITFQSANGNATSAELSYASTDFTNNYTVKLDSAKYINFKALTLTSKTPSLGLVFDIANAVSNIQISNCIINAAKTTDVIAVNGGINATLNFTGTDITIKGNTINEGLNGIYLAGKSPLGNVVIDGNIIKDSTAQYSIYLSNATAPKIINNDIEVNAGNAITTFGGGLFAISGAGFTGAFQIDKNKIRLGKNSGSIYGLVVSGAIAGSAALGSISNNKISGNGNISSNIKGIRLSTSSRINVFNNVVSVGTSYETTSNGFDAYPVPLSSANNGYVNYYNNTFQNTSAPSNSYPAVIFNHEFGSNGAFDQTNTRFYNNVVVNKGAGPAMHYQYGANFVKSDYNLLFTEGPILVRMGPVGNGWVMDKSMKSLQSVKDTLGSDWNSVQYRPVFTNNEDLVPDAAKDSSWIMQGRGIQLAGNDKDFNGNPRSTTLTDGVPDLGAYEFMPIATPPAIKGVPLAPATGSTQLFMMGTDTIAKIKWQSGTVPTAITLQRYTGVIPPGLATGDKSMYYYVHANATGGSGYKYDLNQYYIDPWMRNIDPESSVKQGITDASDKWLVKADSKIDSFLNRIDQPALDVARNFTGMTDGKLPDPPVYVTTPDSSNLGTRFWVAYGAASGFVQSNNQVMRLYLSAEQPSVVTVKINGTNYVKTYNVPANTTILSDAIPKKGVYDARLEDEGLFNRGISVESDKPIGVIESMDGGGGSYSGTITARILPTGAYGNTYTALAFRQKTVGGALYSRVNIIGDNDNTVVEITPSAPTKGGRPAGVPFTVRLNRGQVYQLLGGTSAGGNGSTDYDLSGTTVISIPNSEGKCYPFAMFSGSSGTSITCSESEQGTNQYLIQQNFPSNAWGTDYLTVPASGNGGLYQQINHIYRVLVKDPATVVKRNGVVETGLVNNSWYEFQSNKNEYIQASAPVQVCQYSGFFLGCGNDEFFNSLISESQVYLTPLGHGIKDAVFYRVAQRTETAPPPGPSGGQVFHLHQDLTVIIPTEGVASLRIDGSSTVDTVFTHPKKPGYSVVIKRWDADNKIGHVKADTTFTAVFRMIDTYSTVYNLGLKIPPTKFTDSIKNVYNISSVSNVYTCVGTPFHLSIFSPVSLKTINWKLSGIAGLTPAQDVVDNNAVPTDTIVNNFITYYVYTLNKEFKIAGTGTYTVPVTTTYSENPKTCDKTLDGTVDVVVIATPKVDFTADFSGCLSAEAKFTATGSTASNAVLDRWNWNFGDTTISILQNPTKKWNRIGTYNVKLNAIANDGCTTNEAAKDIEVRTLSTVMMVKDSVGACMDASATLTVKNPVAGSTYKWYDAAVGGNVIATGTAVTILHVTGDSTLYVSEQPGAGCESDPRAKVTAYVLPVLAIPVVTVDSIATRALGFAWNAVPQASGYEVSIDNGATWQMPSSGARGLYHIVANLQQATTVTIRVRALGGCNDPISDAVSATTINDLVFVPNSFTPNGDGKNDVLKVYGNSIKEVEFMVFNQWGQKVFETHDPNTGWNGTFGGKMVTSGVYMYVCKVTLSDNTVINKKGSVNVVR